MAKFLPIDSFRTLKERRRAQDEDSLGFLTEAEGRIAKTASERVDGFLSVVLAFVASCMGDGSYEDAYVRNASGVNAIDRASAELSALADSLYSDYLRDMKSFFSDVARDTYLHATYEIQYDLGKWQSVRSLTERELSAIADAKWFDGNRFSDRLWSDKDAMARTLRRTLVEGVVMGYGLKDMVKSFRKAYEACEKVVERLVRTEMNRMQNQALMKAYSENGVERYEYVAILDERTTEICESLDGSVFDVKDAEPGVNMPPTHPNCRSSTIPVWDGKLSVERDAERLDYESWLREYLA